MVIVSKRYDKDSKIIEKYDFKNYDVTSPLIDSIIDRINEEK